MKDLQILGLACKRQRQRPSTDKSVVQRIHVDGCGGLNQGQDHHITVKILAVIVVRRTTRPTSHISSTRPVVVRAT